ncbi:hypothetical protein PV383_21250 [Streptomyces caniscabiei]|uniref:Uncharacterized protein n=1 Tax=Streptomyces caniscabiei TaxID=2746961 RepID=A0ABU4MQG3_9ACTN|nr:hypothetical protein [Streptomyces caniscabiei]MDX2946430.1 hypothetical protein [Streptomyces caniscabiei]MDX2955384.1 hypothetical protein [Streptomyces caniscabiei]MDX2988721.1 hypothetical protein [Streptomyces caniscabiei]MDX3011800.1 hypothetical protein [Streptomyces caniscabiei]MDX3039683.1 hypothetical protein [Streptomyces caniscabiei]
MNPSAGLVGDFVGRVLDEFEKLAIAVSALSDSTLSVGVLGYETGVDGIRLEDTGRLLDNGVDYRRGRRRHWSCTPEVKDSSESVREGPTARVEAGPCTGERSHRVCDRHLRSMFGLVKAVV